MATGIVIDPRFMEHETGPGHPERPDRIRVLLPDVLDRHDVTRVEARQATGDEITRIHGEGHFEQVARTRAVPRFAFDSDTVASPGSFEAACLAAGGVLALLDEVMAGRLSNGFALVRPPGHHAERERAMGFCLFNNVAIAAAHARARHGLERILIVDWDVHHGNGTQHLFARDPHVLYLSTHRHPFYPGTGAMEEVGEGDGTGFTVNIPFPGGFGDPEYAEAFNGVVEPIAYGYEPQLVLISAGFDAHWRDPLGGMQVTEPGFAAMARSLLRIADKCAGGRCVAVLEGGYDLQALHDSAGAVLDELCGHVAALPPPKRDSYAWPVLDAVRSFQEDFWKF